jgi:hypothetical protein
MRGSPRLRSLMLVAALSWMVIVNSIVIFKNQYRIAHGYGDFASLYTAGTQVLRGQGDDLYNPSAQWKVQQEFASGVTIRQGPLPYVRPPFEALLFSRLAAWPYPTALLRWTILKLVLLLAVPFIVVRRRSWKAVIPLWAVGILAIGTFPEYMDLLMGQDAALFTCLFAVSYWLLDTHRDALAGLMLGLALFKFQLVIPFVLVLLIAGRIRLLIGFATAAAAVIATSIGVSGWDSFYQYPRYLLALNRIAGAGMIWPENQMNLRGLLTFFTGSKPYPGPIHWLLAPIALAAIIFAGLQWRKADDRLLPEAFGLALIVTIVTSYYAYDYDLLLLMVPLVAFCARTDYSHVDNLTRNLEHAGMLLLLLTPAYWFARDNLNAECLMVLPLIAVGIALVRRLKIASKPPSQPALADGRA